MVLKSILLGCLLFFFGINFAHAETSPADANEQINALRNETNWLWTCIAAFLVFFMQAGFAMVETGFTRAKNAVNILMKNLMDFSVGSLMFWLVGFGLMFGVTNGVFGTSFFMVSGLESGEPDPNTYTFWMFQVVFAATAATIVSGGVAERLQYVSYIVYSIIITALIYPIFGSWVWGSLFLGSDNAGWLEKMGFLDFAGSTVVHSLGGWAALAGTLCLGPRLGKYGPDGSVRVIPGHSIPLAALGVFILWLGWFGFNPGSTTSIKDGSFAHIAVTTNLAAAAGAVSTMVVSWLFSKVKKPDLGMTLNGALAGLVAITAPCNIVTTNGAIAIGLIAGVLVYFSVLFFDRIYVDDPVGAISVHGVCGLWGTLACGLFGTEVGLLYGHGVGQLGIQLVGGLVCFLWAFGTCMAVFLSLKAAGLLRVEPRVEIAGLDTTEMGMEAYAGFTFTDPTEYTGILGEPRPAKLPPSGERFDIVISGIENGDLMHVWSNLCQPSEGKSSAEFMAIYPHMTKVMGNTFHFRGGDPETIRNQIEKLFKGVLKNQVEATVKKSN